MSNLTEIKEKQLITELRHFNPCLIFYFFFAASFINSIIQEYEC